MPRRAPSASDQRFIAEFVRPKGAKPFWRVRSVLHDGGRGCPPGQASRKYHSYTRCVRAIEQLEEEYGVKR